MSYYRARPIKVHAYRWNGRSNDPGLQIWLNEHPQCKVRSIADDGLLQLLVDVVVHRVPTGRYIVIDEDDVVSIEDPEHFGYLYKFDALDYEYKDLVLDTYDDV